MNVTSIGQYLPTANTQSGKNVAAQAPRNISPSNENQQSIPRKVDMRNISLNEINELIRAGVDGLLDVMPWPGINLEQFKNDIDGSYREQLANKKIDFLGQIERSISFEKSRGQSTNFLDNILSNLKQIHGTEFPSKIDTTA